MNGDAGMSKSQPRKDVERLISILRRRVGGSDYN